MAGYTRQSANNIVDDGIINASDFNDEFNSIETAFNAATGHTHDGTAANGARIVEVGPSGDLTVSGTTLTPLTTNTLDIGTASTQFKNLYLDGKIYADGIGEDTTVDTDKKVQFRDSAIYINSSADGQLDVAADTEVQIDTATLDVNADADVSGTLTVGGTVTATGVLTADAGINVDNITIDGSEIDLSTGDLTVDVAGDIVLDADGGDIIAKDGGTQYAALTNTTGNLTLKSGSTTAVDFTGANADFAGTVDVTGAATMDSTLDVTGNTTLAGTLDVTGNTTLSGTLDVTGNTDVTGNLTVDGNTVIGDAATDTVTVNADVASNLIPSADSTYKLGDSTNYWSAGYVDVLHTTGNANVGGNATITGNLTVNGTTVTVNSSVTSLDDPVLTLGGDVDLASDDNKDRGVEFRWHDGSNAKLGFFGFDDSTGRMTFIPDASNSGEVFSGTKGKLDVGGIFLNNTEVTATAAELNKLDGASVTTSELNVLDGITASTAELNILDGVNATASEINTLDGITASTAELNKLDGVTASTAELNTLDGVTASTAEVNLLDGAAAKTVVNSKAVIYGSSGEVEANSIDFGNWTITESGGVLKFATGGTDKMKLDASGNLTVVGNITAYGSI